MSSGAVVGIDLGTTNTVVATVDGGRATALADENGERLIPSVVSFHPSGQVIVGKAAKERRLNDATNTIYSIKRLIGRAWGSADVMKAKERFPFDLREGPGNAVLCVARGETYTLSEISAYVLRKAKAVAEAAMGKPVERAVITVPANFNDLQRAATKVAGRVAGLEVMRILNEPTAAALAYGYGKSNAERIAVYDFGGGTFDVTLLDLSGNVFEVLATSGDSFLGGDDIDLAIADEMAKSFLKEHRYDPRSDKQVFERVRAAAETLKMELSTKQQATVELKEIAHGPGGRALSSRFTMGRGELDKLVAPLAARSFNVCKEALATARANVKEFDQVILVGGSTRIPLIRDRVAEFFGREPLGHVSPDEVVAIGAGIQAMALTAHERRRGDQSSPPADIDPRTGRPRTLGGLGQAAAQAASRVRTDSGIVPEVSGPEGASTARGVGPGRQTGSGLGPLVPQTLYQPMVAPGGARSESSPSTADFGGKSNSGTLEIEPDAPVKPPPIPKVRPTIGSRPGDFATKPSIGAEAKRAIEQQAASQPSVSDTQPGVGGGGSAAQKRPVPTATMRSDDSVMTALPLVGVTPAPSRTEPKFPGHPQVRGPSELPLVGSGAQPAPMPPSPALPREPSIPDDGLQVDEHTQTLARKQTAPIDLFADVDEDRTGQQPAVMLEEPTRDHVTHRKPALHGTAPMPIPSPLAASVQAEGPPPIRKEMRSNPAMEPPPVPPPRAPSRSTPEGIFDPPPPLIQAKPRGVGATQVMASMPAVETPTPPPPLLPLTQARVPQQQQSAPHISDMRAPAAPLLVDVTPLSLCVETVGGYCDVIIARNTPVPCDRTRVFVTAKNNQRVVKVRVAQGESTRFQENTQLGEVLLSEIREGLRGDVEISVTFEIDSDGMLQVRAEDVGTGRAAQAQLRLIGIEGGQSPESMRARQQRQQVV